MGIDVNIGSDKIEGGLFGLIYPNSNSMASLPSLHLGTKFMTYSWDKLIVVLQKKIAALSLAMTSVN